MKYEIEIPLRIKSEQNISHNWKVRAAYHKLQRETISLHLLASKKPKLPCKITFCRIAPRKLDSHDNLRYALKWSVDCISEWITGDARSGRADSNPNLTFEFDQKYGGPKVYALRVTFEECDKLASENISEK